MLLSAERDEVEGKVVHLIQERSVKRHVEWTIVPTPLQMVNGQLLITNIADLPSILPSSLPETGSEVGYVLISQRAQASFAPPSAKPDDATRHFT